MKVIKSRTGLGIIVLAIICLLIIPIIVNAQAIKTTVAEIITNPDKYDGKMVSVDGTVTALKEKVSKKGNPYFTIKLTHENKSLSIFSFGKPSIKEGDSVRVMGRYQKIKHVSGFIFYNEVDASGGSIEKM